MDSFSIMPDYDVLIVGSGVVGNTLACALLQGGMRIGLVEATPPIVPCEITDKLDLRVFAITRASERIFTNLGVWEAIVNQRVSPFRQMHVWDSNGVGAVHFDSATLLEPTLGYIIEHNVIQTALNVRLTDFADRLTFHRPTKVQHFQLTTSAMEVYLENGEKVTTHVLVSAEGANASLRTLAGIPCSSYDYGQLAIVANVQTELPHQETARQRFLSEGVLAFLPLVNPHTCSIVWSVDTPTARRLMKLDTLAFQQALTDAFAHQLGEIVDCGQRAAFPLCRRHAQHYVEPRLALVGDAAHTVHPLAGQGVNLGLLDISALSEVILQTYANKQDFGSYSVLRRYERWRRGNNLTMLWLMDGFKQLFATTLPPVQWLRNAGLNVTNAITPLKTAIMQQAMGLKGDLPRLARLS